MIPQFALSLALVAAGALLVFTGQFLLKQVLKPRPPAPTIAPQPNMLEMSGVVVNTANVCSIDFRNPDQAVVVAGPTSYTFTGKEAAQLRRYFGLQPRAAAAE